MKSAHRPAAPDESRALTDAVRFLARCERSANQVSLFLSHRGYSDREVRSTLITLHRLGYLDDETVAGRVAHSQLLRRPLGRSGLLEVLKLRGFSAEIADRAVRRAYDATPEEAVAARFLKKLPVKFKDPMRETRRRAALLLARQFSEDVIEPLLASAPAEQKPW